MPPATALSRPASQQPSTFADAIFAPLGQPATMVILIAGATIAAFQPFDRIFAAVTFDVPLLRAAAIFGLGYAGACLAPGIGLRIEVHHFRHPLRTLLAIAAAVAVVLACVDGLIFRHVVPYHYSHGIETVPLAFRYLYFMPRAFNESILYRLFLTTVIASALGRFWHEEDGKPSAAVFWIAMTVAQLINIFFNVVTVFDHPVTLALLAYDMTRYVAPGVVWGWLYWKHGFASNEAAAVGVHVFFQPLLGAWLA